MGLEETQDESDKTARTLKSIFTRRLGGTGLRVGGVDREVVANEILQAHDRLMNVYVALHAAHDSASSSSPSQALASCHLLS